LENRPEPENRKSENISQNNSFSSYDSGFDEQIDEISINVFHELISGNARVPLGRRAWRRGKSNRFRMQSAVLGKARIGSG
jgi:hypothetical protein